MQLKHKEDQQTIFVSVQTFFYTANGGGLTATTNTARIHSEPEEKQRNQQTNLYGEIPQRRRKDGVKEFIKPATRAVKPSTEKPEQRNAETSKEK